MFFFDSKTLERTGKLIAWIFIIILLLVGCSQLYDSGHKALHPKEARQESIKEKNTKEKANNALQNGLNKDKQLVSSNNDSPSYGLNYAKYIDSIKYTGSQNVTIYVNSEFQNLDEINKTNVINGAQDMAKTTLWQEKIISQDQLKQNVFATVNYGNNAIGQSSIGNYSKIKWSE